MRLTTILPNLLCLLLCMSACVSHEQLVNFNQGPAFPAGVQSIPTVPALLIQSDDLVEIAVYAQDLTAIAPFTLQGMASFGKNQGNTNVTTNNTYLINTAGNIDFPVLGKVKLANLTLEAAHDTLQHRIATYVTNPIVTIRFLNFKFTVLGEVIAPTTYTVSETQISILEALGKAGDLTLYGNRENILIIREQNGQREFGHINLRDRNVFQSPYFYLKQNDVIYVEPIPQKASSVSDKTTAKVLPWVSGGAILINVLILLLRK